MDSQTDPDLENEFKEILTYVLKMINKSRKSLKLIKEDTIDFWKNFKKTTNAPKLSTYYKNLFYDEILPELPKMPIEDSEKVSIYYSIKYPLEDDELELYETDFTIISDYYNVVLWYLDPAHPHEFTDEIDLKMWEFMLKAAQNKDFWKKRSKNHWEKFRAESGCEWSADALAKRFEQVLLPNIHVMPFDLKTKVKAYHLLRVEVDSSIMAELSSLPNVKLGASGLVEELIPDSPSANLEEDQSASEVVRDDAPSEGVTEKMEKRKLHEEPEKEKRGENEEPPAKKSVRFESASVEPPNSAELIDEIGAVESITEAPEKNSESLEPNFLPIEAIAPVSISIRKENLPKNPKDIVAEMIADVLSEICPKKLEEVVNRGEEFKTEFRNFLNRDPSEIESIPFWIEQIKKAGEGLRKAEKIQIEKIKKRAKKRLEDSFEIMTEREIDRTLALMRQKSP